MVEMIPWDVLKCLADPIKDQLRYVICPRSYTSDLREEVDKLRSHLDWIQSCTEKARNDCGIVYDVVTNWEASAETALMVAEDLLRNFEGAAETCCCRNLPDLNRLYELTTKDKIETIKRLLRIGRDIKAICRMAPASGTEDCKGIVFESRASILLDIMDALGSKSVVGVYGMGGVGKSTLLGNVREIIDEQSVGSEAKDHANTDILKQSLFDWVARADLSGGQDIESIQEVIANALKLDMTAIKNVELRANCLLSRLDNEVKMKKKVLIILDNLSEKLDLKKVGIPCETNYKVRGCKLLLTSRDRNVLTGMHCDGDSVFRLPKLHEEEAKILFKKMVGETARQDEIEPFMDKALPKCAGLPQLIVDIAGVFIEASSSGCRSSLLNNALNQIERFSNEGISKKINEMIQSSYDRLIDDVKSFLQLCVVYDVPEPKRENLVRYGVGYVLASNYKSMDDARSRMNTLISTLETSSLSLDDGDARIFKIHGLLYQFVASRDHHLFVLKDQHKLAAELQKNKLKSCMALCFSYIDIRKLPKELDCPELLIFLLFAGSEYFEVSDSYFNSMRKLMVLNLTGICLTRSTSPSQFRSLEKLHTLCLDECSLEDVSMLGELKGLQILSFVKSTIHQLPKEIGQLTELRLLDLSDCSQLKKIEPDVLGSLTKLEELYMENSFDRWNAVETETPRTNASLIELNNMEKLYTLNVSIPDPSKLPVDLEVEKLTKYKIQIGDVPHLSSSESTKTLMIKLNREATMRLNPQATILWNACIQAAFRSTDNLHLDGSNVKSICNLSSEDAFPKLKRLCIENSPFVLCILEGSSHTAFQKLESLILTNLDKLEKIWRGSSFSKSFNSLKEVRVKSCGVMEVLFPFRLAGELRQLKEIRVVGCAKMKSIVEVDERGDVKFCYLHVLELRDLPNIKSFSIAGTATSSSTSDDPVGTQVAFFNGQQVLIPSLESLTMDGLPNLNNIWSNEYPTGLNSLQVLEVKSCESLSKVINFGSLAELRKLHTLIVAHCVSVHAIFDLDGSIASGNIEIPSKLTTFCLEELPRLMHIWNKDPRKKARFRYLKQLKVFGCDDLRFIFFPSMINSLEHLRELTVRSCKKMEMIIMEEQEIGMKTSEPLAFPMLTYICFEHLERLTCFYHEKGSQEVQSQHHIDSCCHALFNEKVAFPKLETLKITGMDSIEMIWDPQVAANSFPTLRSLCVDGCSKLVNIGPSCILRWLCNLEIFEVKTCGSVEHVFRFQQLNSLDGNEVACFSLKQLQLIELPKLKCIWDTELFHQVKFIYPHSVSVSKCENLISLIPPSIARDLMQLEQSEIDELGYVECIENTSHASNRQPLKTLELHGGDKAEILALQPQNEMLLHKQPPDCSKEGIRVEVKEGPSRELKHVDATYFERMETLEVSHCDQLSTMFTPATAKKLKRLRELRISYCKKLTEVISEEGDMDGHEVVFDLLKYMELDGLTGLKCFSSSRCTLSFPMLKDIIVTKCLNMKFFSGGKTVAPKVDKILVSKAAECRNTDLNKTIRDMYENKAMLAGLEFVRLSEFPDWVEKWHGEIYPMKSSWQLESLVVDKCASLINGIPSKLMLVLDNTRRLQVRDCDSLEEILDLKGLETGISTQLLPKLQFLVLVNLPKLRQLWNKDLQGKICFNSLRYLTLYKCSDLVYAFIPSMARCFANLEKMEIKECDMMKGVIMEEEVIEEEGQESSVDEITFPWLSQIKLEHLPKLESFLLGKNHTLNCPRLKDLIIAHCPRMRSLMGNDQISLFTPQVKFCQLESMAISHMDNLRTIWPANFQETLTVKFVRKVEAENCGSLKIMFPLWVATNLSQLEELRVQSCGLKEIVRRGNDSPCSPIAQVSFSKLISLVLHDMPRLKNFCPNLSTLNWRSLKELRVTHCNKLNPLFAASLSKWIQRDDHQVSSDQEAHSSIERDFPNLERLLLVEKKIQMIQDDSKIPDDIFAKPKALILACFHDKKAMFPPRFLLERFRKLQSLEIFCSSFEDIFPNEELVDEGEYSVLENLRELKLSKLHYLKRVWRRDYLVSKVLESIQIFEVSDCPGLTTLFPTVACFQNLMKLVVNNSSGLIHLVTLLTATNLVNLMDMAIIGCQSMDAIVANDGNEEGKVISFEKLEKLRLQNLPSLVCFSSTSHSLELPSLIDVVVEECPRMKIFSKGTLSTPKLLRATLSGYLWESHLEVDLNSAIQKLSA